MPGSRQRRSARIAALALGGALTLGACGSGDEGAATDSSAPAAIVDGHEITVGEAQQSSREVGDIIAAQASATGQEPQQVGPDQLISSLVQVPTILAFGEDNDVPVPSAAAIEEQLGDAVHSPSQTTVDFFRANAVYSSLDQAQQQEIAEQVQDLDITYSPRYRPDDEAPNWLETPEPAPFEMP